MNVRRQMKKILMAAGMCAVFNAVLLFFLKSSKLGFTGELHQVENLSRNSKKSSLQNHQLLHSKQEHLIQGNPNQQSRGRKPSKQNHPKQMQPTLTTTLKDSSNRKSMVNMGTVVNQNQNSSWENEQAIRLDTMQDACRNLTHRRLPLPLWLKTHHAHLGHILVSDKYKTLYCFVPKAACTNWKRIFLYLNGVASNRREAKLMTHKMKNYITLANIPEEQALFKLQNYSKFIFVRNPMTRILSAFREKFTSFKRWGRSDWVIHLANVINLYYGNQTHLHTKLKFPRNGYNITFQEFVRFLGSNQSMLNFIGSEHWKPMANICYPCHIQYDAVGKFETFDVDSLNIIRRLKRDDLLNVVLQKSDHSTRSSSEDVLRKYYSPLTASEKEGLNWRYGNDFSMFGYTPIS